MAPEEKANELVEKMKGGCCKCPFDSKEAALTCCDEVMKALPMYTGNLNPTWKYWSDVKDQIQLL